VKPVTAFILRNAALLVLFAPLAMADVAPPMPDCGTNALYLVCKNIDPKITLYDVARALPPQKPDGYSLQELATAAVRLGVSLEGRRIDPSDFPLRTRTIALVQLAQEGHFVALFPVGRLGKLVQVLDPPKQPQIIEYKALLESGTWTGKCLIQRRGSNGIIWGATGVLVLLSSLVFGRRRPKLSWMRGGRRFASPAVPSEKGRTEPL